MGGRCRLTGFGLRTSARALVVLECSHLADTGLAQRPEFLLDDSRDRRIIHRVVLVAEHIAQPADAAPRYLRLPFLHDRAELFGGFADSFEAPLDRIARLVVELRSGSHTRQMGTNAINVVDDIPQPFLRDIRRHTRLGLRRWGARAAE